MDMTTDVLHRRFQLPSTDALEAFRLFVENPKNPQFSGFSALKCQDDSIEDDDEEEEQEAKYDSSEEDDLIVTEDDDDDDNEQEEESEKDDDDDEDNDNTSGCARLTEDEKQDMIDNLRNLDLDEHREELMELYDEVKNELDNGGNDFVRTIYDILDAKINETTTS